MRTTLSRAASALALLTCVTACHAWSQDELAEPVDGTQVVTGDATIDTDEVPPDAAIERTIRETLGALELYERLTVRVREGVVSLAGVARSDEAVRVAGDLAARTRGVAAVVNELEADDGVEWSLRPARDQLEELARDAVAAIPAVAVGIVVLVLAFVASRLTRWLAARLIVRTTESALVKNVVVKGVALLTVLAGLYIALRITGLTRVALTVVSGTGLIGLALGFAFRDIAENFLASILLSVQRPFRIDDVINVDGHTGIVRKVTSRGTLLMDFDGNHIQIANSTVYKNTIKNFTSNPRVRIDFMVGVGYDDSVSRAQSIALGVLEEHPAILQDPEPLVLVDDLGASTVNLRIYFWIDGSEHSMLKMKSSVMRLTVNAFTDAGVSMPDDAREVVFPQGVPVTSLPERSGGAQQAGAPVPKRREHADDHRISQESEGDLKSETADLLKQAEASRDPEEGENVLPEDGPTTE